MTKQRIIDIMNEFVESGNFVGAIIDSDTNKKDKIGTNQFRSLSDVCKSAECYDEIEMLIEYNFAKNVYKKGNVWKAGAWGEIKDDLILAMRKIRDESEEKDVLNNLSLFFGYLYWKGRIITGNNNIAYQNKNSGGVR